MKWRLSLSKLIILCKELCKRVVSAAIERKFGCKCHRLKNQKPKNFVVFTVQLWLLILNFKNCKNGYVTSGRRRLGAAVWAPPFGREDIWAPAVWAPPFGRRRLGARTFGRQPFGRRPFGRRHSIITNVKSGIELNNYWNISVD